MGDKMKHKYNNIISTILPSKKINIFTIITVILGVTTGAIFANIIGINDKNLVIDKIKLFIESINTNSINNISVLKNSISINLIYVIIIWILGMTLLGIILCILMLFIKSFIIGFSLSSFIITYKYKGIILSTLYLIFGQLLNIVTIIILTIYSILFTKKLLDTIFKNNNKDMKKTLKNYLIILLIAIIISTISSLCESFLLPPLIKLIIKLYI